MLRFHQHNPMIALATLAKLARTQEGVLVKVLVMALVKALVMALVKALIKVLVMALVKALVKVLVKALVKVKFRSTVFFSKYQKLRTRGDHDFTAPYRR